MNKKTFKSKGQTSRYDEKFFTFHTECFFALETVTPGAHNTINKYASLSKDAKFK